MPTATGHEGTAHRRAGDVSKGAKLKLLLHLRRREDRAMKAIVFTLMCMVLVVSVVRCAHAADAPKDPWTTDYVTGVIAIWYENEVQDFLFVSKDGHRLLVSATACGQYPKCGILIRKLASMKRAEIANLDKPGAQL